MWKSLLDATVSESRLALAALFWFLLDLGFTFQQPPPTLWKTVLRLSNVAVSPPHPTSLFDCKVKSENILFENMNNCVS